MQTNISKRYRDTPLGKAADDILRRCVHCGFCNATCPTYQLLNNELDGPRGRIYLIKQMLEGQPATQETRLHLDRCLTCLNCESTCPSGVAYGDLIDIGREIVEQNTRRPAIDSLHRAAIRAVLAYPKRFNPLLRLGQFFRGILPQTYRHLIPARSATVNYSPTAQARKVLLLEGCVQPGLSPGINTATSRVLEQLGITAIRETPAACCGALHHHTSAAEQALDFARQRIDAWWPHVEAGVEAIVSTASGCGVHIKHYHRLLENDLDYKDKAIRIKEITKDISEVLKDEDMTPLRNQSRQRIAWHPPCTLQHGQKLAGTVENILLKLGFELSPVNESHLCCGAAGSYTLLQPLISSQLRERKVNNLLENEPDIVATGNIGCLHHLQSATNKPVLHWIELVADTIGNE